MNILMSEMQCQPRAAVRIRVNGEPREIAAGSTLTALVEELELDPDRLAIELDRKIVKRPSWSDQVLDDGSEVELVQFVGGG